MHLTWRNLRTALTRAIHQPEAEREFRRIKEQFPVLAAHGEAGALVNWLSDFRSHDQSDEDEVLLLLRRLILDSEHTFWQSGLFLGLWQPMEWVHRKLQPFGENESTIISAIWGGLIAALEIDKLWNQPGIAKRVMYAVWERAKKELLEPQRERERLDRLVNMEFVALPRCAGEPLYSAFENLWPIHRLKKGIQAPHIPEEIESLRQKLRGDFALRSDDADLLIDHFVRDQPLYTIAAQRGLSYAACRQRCSRVARRLRKKCIEKGVGVTKLRPSSLN